MSQENISDQEYSLHRFDFFPWYILQNIFYLALMKPHLSKDLNAVGEVSHVEIQGKSGQLIKSPKIEACVSERKFRVEETS